MRFINNDGVVLHQQAVLLDLRQQDTVGHQLDLSGITDLIVKTHLIANAATEAGFQLVGDAIGHGARRQTSWLRMANQPGNAPAQLQTNLRQLGGFT